MGILELRKLANQFTVHTDSYQQNLRLKQCCWTGEPLPAADSSQLGPVSVGT